MTSKNRSKLLTVFLYLFAALFMIVLYVILHEGGHALVILFSGASLTDFSISLLDIGAHVSYSGELTPIQTVLMNIAGVGLPFLLWLVFMLLVPRRANRVVELFKAASSLAVLNVFLVWIVFPFLYMQGIAPSDDATNFLQNSGLPPLLVAAGALGIYVCGWFFFRSKTLGFRAEVAYLRQPVEDQLSQSERRSLTIMGVVMAAALLTAFAANGFRFTTAQREFRSEPPAGYTLLRIVQLDQQAYESEVLASFTLTESRTIGFFLRVTNINTPYLDVRLIYPDGTYQTIIHGEAYTANLDTPHFSGKLLPGAYRLELTNQLSPGQVEIFTVGLP